MDIQSHPAVAAVVKVALDAAAIVAAMNGLLGFIQSLFGAVAAVLSAIYLYYRVKAIRKKLSE